MHARRGLLALTASALALGAVAGPASAAGTTRWVDDDGRAGPGGCSGSATASSTIQGAVDASSAGDTIIVCPGSYTESVTVPSDKDGITIKGATFWTAKIVQPADAVGPSSVLLGIARGANGVTVQGLVFVAHAPSVVSATPDCGLDAAIWVMGRNAAIRSNRVRATGDTFGLCGYRDAIRVGAPIRTVSPGGAPLHASALVSHNAVRDFVEAGITAIGDGVSATIERNSVRYWHLGATLVTAATARVRPSVRWAGITAPAGNVGNTFGIALGIGASGVIDGNEVSSGPDAVPTAPAAGGYTPLLSWGITTAETPSLGITGNTVRRAYYAITAFGAAGITVSSNVATDGFINLGISSVVDSRITRNQVGPGALGVVVDGGPFTAGQNGGGSSGNTIVANTALGHEIDDCYDSTSGAGTAGTANTWKRNTGATSNPSGLCSAF